MTLATVGALAAGSMLLAGCAGTSLAGCGLTAGGTDASAQFGGQGAGPVSAGPGSAGLGGPPGGAIAAPGRGTTLGITAPTSRPQRVHSAIITLLTGDRVRLDAGPDGQQAVMPVPPKTGMGAAAKGAGMVRFSWAGDQLAVPDVAVPYLGGTLDPRLFDVSYLARARLDDAHSSTLPVTITYRGQTGGTGLAGVRVTSRSGDMAHAVVAKADAGKLGLELASQWRASRAGVSAAPVGQLPGIAKITLAPPSGAPALPAALPQPAAVRPAHTGALAYHTLTLNFTDLDGDPGAAVGWVQNLADARLTYFILPDIASYPATGTPGPVSFSVPEGTYSIQFSVLTPDPGTILGVDAALVVKPQLMVNSDETVTLDARTATPYHLALRPAVSVTSEEDFLGLTRGSTAGGCGFGAALAMALVSYSAPATSELPGASATDLRATPTAAVSDGTLGFDARAVLTTEDPLGVPSAAPAYYFDFPHVGSIPSSLSFTVAQTALTAVHSHIYASPSGNDGCVSYHGGAVELWPAIYLWGSFDEVGGLFIDRPLGEVTDYWYTSAPNAEFWQGVFNASDCSRRWDAPRRIQPGEQITEDWGKAPLVPTPADHQALVEFTDSPQLSPMLDVCAACRQDDNAMLYLMPLGDSDPTHYYENVNVNQVPDTSSLDFYRNGALAFTSSSVPFGQITPFNQDLPLLPSAATYRLDWTQSRPGDPAASTGTDWTFQSSRADPPAHLPATEVCAPDTGQGCSFLPLLFITYDLPLNDNSQATAGKPVQIAFTVEHQQSEPAPTGVSATVSASFDDGTTWTAPQPATAQGGNAFAVTIDQPPLANTSGFVSLRVTARDGAGNAVTQTIIRAYGLTS